MRLLSGGNAGCRGTVLSAEALCGDGNRQLDVYSGSRTICGYGIYQLPRHDRRTAGLGLDSFGIAGTKAAYFGTG